MAIVERSLKDGRLVHRVVVRDSNGKMYPTKQFDTFKKAEKYERQLLKLKDDEVPSTPTKHRGLTLSEYYHETWKTEARTKITLGWRSAEEQMFRDHVEPYLGKAKMAEIHKRDIAKLLADLQEKKGLKGQTVQHVYTMLSGIFKYSIEVSEIRESNPVLSKFKPLIDDYVPTYLKPSDARRFMALVTDHWLGPSIWIMVGTGLRVCEVIGLQYGDVDLPARQISLRRQWRRKEKRVALVKNKKAEKPIPIAGQLAEYLETKLSPSAKATDWVIQNRSKPGEIATYHAIYNALRRLCAKHNFPLLSPHGLRHTTSGIWNERGAKPSDLQDLYNHKDEASTKRYNHEVPDRLAELAKGVQMREEVK